MSDMEEDEGVEVEDEEEYCWNGGGVSTEDDEDNRTKPISLIYQEPGYHSSLLSSTDLSEFLSAIKPSTLMTQCDFFHLSLYR